MSFGLSEYIPEQAVLKKLSLNFSNIKVYGGARILKIARIYPFTKA